MVYESPVEAPLAIIDVWTVEPDQREELIRVISENLEQHVLPLPGFVSAQIYESVNGQMLVLSLRVRSEADLREVSDSAELQRDFREARRIGRAHSHFYRLVANFGDQPEPPES